MPGEKLISLFVRLQKSMLPGIKFVKRGAADYWPGWFAATHSELLVIDLGQRLNTYQA
jgi:hypothetical protein